MRKALLLIFMLLSVSAYAGVYTDSHGDYSSEAVLNKVIGRDEDFATQDPWLNHAIDVIYEQYGDIVSVKEKSKDLIKFGRCETVSNVEPGTTIMTQIDAIDNETYISTDAITTVSSESAADTQTFVVEGHTVSNNVFTFVTQTGTLNGQNKVTLTTPLARSTRFYNSGTVDLVGPIYVYEDSTVTGGKPDIDDNVHLTVRATKNQSEKAATTISNTDYWIVTEFYGDVLEKTGGVADVRLEIRLPGKVFREVAAIAAGSGNEKFRPHPYIIVPKNSDVRLVAVGSADNLDVSGGIVGVLASVVE